MSLQDLRTCCLPEGEFPTGAGSKSVLTLRAFKILLSI